MRTLLSLSEDDVVLDLCCGNGVVTRRLSPFVAHVHAIDFSSPFIANARQFCSAPNITYYCHDVTSLQSLALGEAPRHVTKALVYDALSYFDRPALGRLLQEVGQRCPNLQRVLLGSVLFQPLKWRFFNTISRKLRYLFLMRLLGRNYGLGTWWSPADLRRARGGGWFPGHRDRAPALRAAHGALPGERRAAQARKGIS